MTNFFEQLSFRLHRWILENPKRLAVMRVFLEIIMLPFEPDKLKRKLKKFYFFVKHTCNWKFDLNKTYWDIRKFVWKKFWWICKLPKRITQSCIIHTKRIYWRIRKRLYVVYRTTHRLFRNIPTIDCNKLYWDARKRAYKIYRMIFKKQ